MFNFDNWVSSTVLREKCISYPKDWLQLSYIWHWIAHWSKLITNPFLAIKLILYKAWLSLLFPRFRLDSWKSKNPIRNIWVTFKAGGSWTLRGVQFDSSCPWLKSVFNNVLSWWLKTAAVRIASSIWVFWGFFPKKAFCGLHFTMICTEV